MWCGVVWCGVVWCGVVLCGVVWCGVVWSGLVWSGLVWSGLVCLRRILLCCSESLSPTRNHSTDWTHFDSVDEHLLDN